MMEKKKYILEVEEDPTTIRLVKLKNGEDGLPCMQFMAVSPYKYDEAYQSGVHDTAKEIEAIKDEAYKRGRKDATDAISSKEQSIANKAYQSGLSDAWEVAKKICMSVNEGGLSSSDVCKIFNVDYYRDAMKNFSPLKAIEKIKAYEQEQQIAIGDEVVFYNGEKCVVTAVENEQVVEVMDENGFSMKMDDGLRNSMKKTGRHFEELVTILKKMKGE